ncbi:hypothetical protein [Rodentibacter sp. Ppn85]|uniref:hypothetical protein n=1 Tax=Rodentibacter sp. Ppn85 TaxID=1908525 RepID=UPI0009C77A7D|nr:hypothetical protein [Rodentibacter sp. Ppn85]OOF61551.1 hypothetical protein BKL51_10525 [Rodentibacter sp. Ppn85]
MTDENKIAYLEMIQGVINRTGTNSFMIKGWAVTLVSALFALSVENYKFLFIALIPILLFWYLDAFFLRQERLFRKLYDDVISKNNSDITFSMNTEGYCVDSQLKIAFSKTLVCFYGLLLFVVIMFLIVFLLSNLEYSSLLLDKFKAFCIFTEVN